MTRIGRLADRMLAAFVPQATAAASATACYTVVDCRYCASTYSKTCFTEYCDGVYRTGYCYECGSC
jgi:hypothetical protein